VACGDLRLDLRKEDAQLKDFRLKISPVKVKGCCEIFFSDAGLSLPVSCSSGSSQDSSNTASRELILKAGLDEEFSGWFDKVYWVAQFHFREFGVEDAAVTIALEALQVMDALSQGRALERSWIRRSSKNRVSGNRTEVKADVHAVEEGAGDPGAVPLDGHGCVRAGEAGMSEAPAGAWVHRSDELECRGKGFPSPAPADTDLSCLERLT
jgi:hypothetical protein